MGITNNGRGIMLNRTYDDSSQSAVTQFKVGKGTTAFNPADTGLEDAVPISGTEEVDSCDAADWNDSADMTTSLNSTTYKEGDASLNLTKDAGASATASTSKTTTSRDFTSKEFSIWIYVINQTALDKLATTGCLNIRFGSGAGDYYEWNKDKSDLTAGQWNLISGLTSANADSSTGTPVLGASDYTYVSLVTTLAATTWSAGDFMMDDIKLVSTGDYLKNFESGYPTIDYTNYEIVKRCRIPTTSANGYAISEFGVFNTDGTPLMETRYTFTAVSKSNTDELIFIDKTVLE